MEIDWQILDKLVQWLILPLVAVWWAHEKRLTALERDLATFVAVAAERQKEEIRTAEALHKHHERMASAMEAVANAVAAAIPGTGRTGTRPGRS